MQPITMKITQCLGALPPADPAVLAEGLASVASLAEHNRLAAKLPALSAIEYRPPVEASPAGKELRIAAWNAERCKYPAPSAALLQAVAADILLLSEVDVGMARSGNRHTVADLGEALGMGFAFGVEFVELGLGDDRERVWHAGQSNLMGYHGNAILSRSPLLDLRLIRLDDGGRWFDGYGRDQRRIGFRMALAARLDTAAGPLVIVSAHLESNSDADDRRRQIERLLSGIADFGPDIPVVIGGDLNTNALPAVGLDGAAAADDWFSNPARYEPLFAVLSDAGFNWLKANTSDPTLRTRPDGTPRPPFRRIDWLATRGVTPRNPQTVPAVDAAGRAISDHDLIGIDVAL